MTTMHPPIPMAVPSPIAAPAEDDLLARLTNARPARTSGSVFTIIAAVLSFGLWHLFTWPAVWAGIVETDRRDYSELIAWWRRRVAPADAPQLDTLARRFRPRPMLIVLPWLIAGFNLVLLGYLKTQGDSLMVLSELTYRHGYEHLLLTRQNAVRNGQSWNDSMLTHVRDADLVRVPGYVELRYDQTLLTMEHRLYPIWMFGLLLGYLLHLRSVRAHVAAVRSLSAWSNRFAGHYHLPGVKVDFNRPGMGVLWIAGGVGLCLLHGWWAIPLVLAGSMQRRYARLHSPQLKKMLAAQVRDGFALSHPVTSVQRCCPAGHCGARLPAAANFCPRCGSRAVTR